MEYIFYWIFFVLIATALGCQAILFVIQTRINHIENLLIERYRSKIDKIPAIVCVLQNHSKKINEYTELTNLHRIAIISPERTIYDLLEINKHVSDRFGFMMRLALVIKSTAKDGNFITIRESITTLEWNIRELLTEFTRLSKQYNSVIRVRDTTILGNLLPWSSLPSFQNN